MNASLSPEDLSRFEQQLRAREHALLAELRAGQERSETETSGTIAGEAADTGDASVADLVIDATTAERQRDTDELRNVQDALGRIDAGTYGLCRKCGKPIDRRRLEAFPAARFDLEHQAEQERRQGGIETPRL